MKRSVILLFCLLSASLFAADLAINGQNGRTYDGGAYDHLSISNSQNITVKNCTFSAITGHVVDIQGSGNVLVEDCDVNGRVDACTGVNIGGGSHGITIKGCDIHDIADDGFQIVGADDIHLVGNTVRALYGCGTDGGCGPCYNGHSDGIELNDNDGVEIRGNLIYDVRSTSAVIIGSWDNQLIQNVKIINNIFYTPECGFVAYVYDARNVEIYNNTMWKGIYGGIAVGGNNQNITMYNNILQSINFQHMGASYNAGIHHFDYNLVARVGQGMNLMAHDLYSVDPKFKRIPHALSSTTYREVTAEDFEIQSGSPCIDRGTSGTGFPMDDYYGTPRAGTYDLGAFEFQGTGLWRPAARLQPPGLNRRQPASSYYDLSGTRRAPDTVKNAGIYITGCGRVFNKTLILK